MAEIKGTLLSIILAIAVFGSVGAVVGKAFSNLSSNVAAQVEEFNNYELPEADTTTTGD